MYTINFEKPIHIHFIGIGGISMSGLAEILLEEGFTISGSDSRESDLTRRLADSGAHIIYGQSAANITDDIDDQICTLNAISEKYELPQTMENLKNNFFIVTGTGCRMRYVHSDPMNNAAIIRISADGTYYEIIAEKNIKPTSELPSHLLIHNVILGKGRKIKTVIHTHPIELVAMTHNSDFLGKDVLSKLLWSMIPETRAFCPKGVGIVPYALPGSMELAQKTVEQLDDYDVVLWEKHGALAIGEDIIEAFDMIDTLTKSAKIYESACSMGFKPKGMSDEQMDELKRVFNL